jgi:hypothetical protein
LYPHALFVSLAVKPLNAEVKRLAKQRRYQRTVIADQCVSGVLSGPQTYIRSYLRGSFSSALDPALMSPLDTDHPLSAIEEMHSESVSLGRQNWPSSTNQAGAERVLLNFLDEAENELEPLTREWPRIVAAQRMLRSVASSIAKRSVGIRLGLHLNEEYLTQYEEVLHDPDSLDRMAEELRALLEESGARFNALETYGQSQGAKNRLIILRTNAVLITDTTAAPTASPERPAHDLPFISVAGYPIPLTFDLFSALRLRSEGVPRGGLPASARASLDRILQLHIGQLAHDDSAFQSRFAEYVIEGHGRLVLLRGSTTPRYRPDRE